ncbi:MAG: hypothetical protein IH818_07720, partial [Acidobacteria bacterium]|nr:hypothetical protein [Acidobacteriota bacterium]
MFDTNVIYESTPVESDRHLIPDDLESIPPGLILAAYLFRIDRSRLNGHDLVRVMKTDARLAAHFQARMFEGMAELAYCPPGGPQAEVVRDSVEVEFASTEIGAA